MSSKAKKPAKQGLAPTPSFSPALTGLLQRTCACGGQAGLDGKCATCKHTRLTGAQRPLVQTKLTINRRGDRYEQETDRIANMVMPMRAPTVNLQAASAAQNATSGTDVQQPDVRFPHRKAVCLEPNGFKIVLDTPAEYNNENVAQGRLRLFWKVYGRTRWKKNTQLLFARGKRQKNAAGQICDCDCLEYRQYIRGVYFKRLPDQDYEQYTGLMKSGRKSITLGNEWQREDINIPGAIPPHQQGCEKEFPDYPGITRDAVSGLGVALRYNFLLQTWDHCQKRLLRDSRQTLTIVGDTPPRQITWNAGWSALTLDDILLPLPSSDVQNQEESHEA